MTTHDRMVDVFQGSPVECWNEHGEPRAIELSKTSAAYGWVYYKHPDGQWVTLRKATPDELYRAERTIARRAEDICTGCNGTGWDKDFDRTCDCSTPSGEVNG
jgi:hypothetical protein